MKYLDQYKEIHEKSIHYGGGNALSVQAHFIQKMIEETESKTLLDFGCGKADYENNKIHNRWFHNILPERYDFAIPKWSKMPKGTFDGVFSVDVMEHIPEEEVDDVLKTHFEKANKFVFLGISTQLANQILPNGENAHCTVEDQDWWTSKIVKANIKKIYTHLHCYGDHNDYRVLYAENM